MATAQQEIKALKQDMADIKGLLEDQLSDRSESNGVLHYMNPEQMKEFANSAGQNLRGYLSEKKGQAIEARNRCESSIHENPFKSAAIAFAGGALLAAFLRK